MFYDPFEELVKMHENMERMFNKLLRGDTRNLIEDHSVQKNKNLAKINQGFRMPIGDLMETENSIVATFEMPGVSKDNIDINLTDTHLEVKAQHKSEKEDKGKNKYSYQGMCSNFYRAIPLPAEVNSKNAKAKLEDGILRIEMEKQKGKQHNRLKIE